jgi:hypothetical protein
MDTSDDGAVYLRTDLHIETEPTEPECWHRTGPSRRRGRLLKGALGKRKNLVHLISTDGGEPLQELVYGRALVKVFEKGSNREARAREAPRPAKLGRVPVHGTAERPVHKFSLLLIATPKR